MTKDNFLTTSLCIKKTNFLVILNYNRNQMPNSKARLKKPQRLTIVCGNLGKLPVPALEYLVLHLNTLQTDIEFQFLPVNVSDSLAKLLDAKGPKNVVSEKKFERVAKDFVGKFSDFANSLASSYDVKNSPTDGIIFVSLATYEGYFYEIVEENYSALFLGDWKKRMAPPSLLEFIVSLVIMQGVYFLIRLDEEADIAHLATRGCIADFNSSLEDVRYKMLDGFICSDCLNVME